MRTGVVSGITDSRPCGEKDGKGIVISSLFPRGLRSWRTQSAGPAIMPPTPALTAVRAPGHHGQGPQPLLRRTAKEALPTGAAQILRSLHSTQALPVTLCVQLYADAFQQIPGRQAGLAFARRAPRRPGNCPRAVPSPCAIIVLINDNKSCRSCGLTRECYRNSSPYFQP